MKIKYIKEGFFDDDDVPVEISDDFTRQDALETLMQKIRKYGLNNITRFVTTYLNFIYKCKKTHQHVNFQDVSLSYRNEPWYIDCVNFYKEHKNDMTLLSQCIQNIIRADDVTGEVNMHNTIFSYAASEANPNEDMEMDHDADRVVILNGSPLFDENDIEEHETIMREERGSGLYLRLPLVFVSDNSKLKFRNKKNMYKWYKTYVMTKPRLEIFKKDLVILQELLYNKFECPIRIYCPVFYIEGWRKYDKFGTAYSLDYNGAFDIHETRLR